jgi:hypothetical protein
MWDKSVSKPHGFRRAIVMKIASWLPCKVLSIRRPGSTSCCEHQSLSNGDFAYAPLAAVTGSWVRCMHSVTHRSSSQPCVYGFCVG